MTASVRIKKFKKISDEIIFNEFDRVNYFVGKNSSGKTSVLNAISYLNDGSNSKNFFQEDSVVEFIVGNKNRFLKWEDVSKNPNNTSHQGSAVLKIFLPELWLNEKGQNGTRAPHEINYASISKEDLDLLNETFAMMNLSPIIAKRLPQNDVWDESAGRRIFVEGDQILTLPHVADGIKSITKFKNWLHFSIKEINREDINNLDCIIFICEEPENYLHPDMQKKIPKIIDEFLQAQEKSIAEKMFFFVATHSPFLISAAADFQNQKTYLMKEGSLCDLNQNIIQASNGYVGINSSWVVAQMLGASITDLGYPENYCILEENSLMEIMKKAKSLNIIRNIEFVSASGLSKVVSLSEKMTQFINLNTLIKCNPYYGDRYYVIVDEFGSSQDNVKLKLKKIKNKLGARFVELRKHDIEDYYINIDENLSKQYFEEKAKGNVDGFVKANFASLIADKITQKEDFSKLFEGELDFLLNSY